MVVLQFPPLGLPQRTTITSATLVFGAGMSSGRHRREERRNVVFVMGEQGSNGTEGHNGQDPSTTTTTTTATTTTAGSVRCVGATHSVLRIVYFAGVACWCALTVCLAGVVCWCGLLVCLDNVSCWCALPVFLAGVVCWCALIVSLAGVTTVAVACYMLYSDLVVSLAGVCLGGGRAPQGVPYGPRQGPRPA